MNNEKNKSAVTGEEEVPASLKLNDLNQVVGGMIADTTLPPADEPQEEGGDRSSDLDSGLDTIIGGGYNGRGKRG